MELGVECVLGFADLLCACVWVGSAVPGSKCVTFWHSTRRCWGGVLVHLDSLFHGVSCVGLLGAAGGIVEPRPDWVYKPIELGPVGD